jgi:membrane protease YdiL (CAAX protease family)
LKTYITKLAHWTHLQFQLIDDTFLPQPYSRPIKRQSLIVIITSLLALIALHYLPQNTQLFTLFLSLFPADMHSVHNREFYRLIFWALCSCVSYLVIPGVTCVLLLKKSLSELGFNAKGYFRHFKTYLLLFLPVALCVFVVSNNPEFQHTYPFFRHPQSLQHLLIWELCYAFQFVCLEFFFRGFIVHGLKEDFGSKVIWLMVIPYCMIHFGKPLPETLASIFAGIALGVVSLRTGSIMGGATIHIAVAWLMDALSLLQGGVVHQLF